MRLAVRALLLILGCAVMVATSQRSRESLSFRLGAGGAETVSLSVVSKKTVSPQLYVQPWKSEAGPKSVRLVGLVSATPPQPEAYARLDPKDTFTVGQEVEGVGRVAFVHEGTFDTDAPGETTPVRLPEDANDFLTVFSPDSSLEVMVGFAVSEMETQCRCTVEEVNIDFAGGYVPPTPDAGTGGSDGG